MKIPSRARVSKRYGKSRALKRALGDAAYGVPVVATKGQHGHALGATGAWEAALALLMVHEGRVPRIVNLQNVDPACDLVAIVDDLTEVIGRYMRTNEPEAGSLQPVNP